MRAVNLVPADERRGAGGTGGRSGGAAYVLLGLLAVLVVVVASYTLQKRSVSEKRTELATLETQAAGTEARAAELASFVQFAGLRVARTQTISSLAASRFDWAHAVREVSRVVPSNVWLTSLQGTVAPGVTLKAAGAGPTGALRSALPVPALEIVGCTTGQDAVARMLSRMRLVDGVIRVALQASVKGDAGSGGGSGGGGDCRQGDARIPQFALVIYFDQAAGAVPTAAKGARSIEVAQITPNGATGATGPAAPTGATP